MSSSGSRTSGSHSAVAFVFGATTTGVALAVAMRALDPGGRTDHSMIQVWAFALAGVLSVAAVLIGGLLAWANKIFAGQMALMAGIGGVMATVAGWVLWLRS